MNRRKRLKSSSVLYEPRLKRLTLPLGSEPFEPDRKLDGRLKSFEPYLTLLPGCPGVNPKGGITKTNAKYVTKN
jgi:hypothetical protein